MAPCHAAQSVRASPIFFTFHPERVYENGFFYTRLPESALE
jgi:hypothetical protein